MAVRRVAILLGEAPFAAQAFQGGVGGTCSRGRVAGRACTVCRNSGGDRVSHVQSDARIAESKSFRCKRIRSATLRALLLTKVVWPADSGHGILCLRCESTLKPVSRCICIRSSTPCPLC